MDAGAKLVILIAEDDPDDVVLLKAALKKAGLPQPAHVCNNGLEAIEYLEGKGDFADRGKFPLPRILITDLKMPFCSGLDLLKWLHAHPACGVIPTLVLSSSAQPRDVAEAYRLGANTYFQKPADHTQLVLLLKEAVSYWNRAVLPETPGNC
jgi:CheY-like chemotaxis protein